jgi:hypothetical protein
MLNDYVNLVEETLKEGLFSRKAKETNEIEKFKTMLNSKDWKVDEWMHDGEYHFKNKKYPLSRLVVGTYNNKVVSVVVVDNDNLFDESIHLSSNNTNEKKIIDAMKKVQRNVEQEMKPSKPKG